MYSFPCLTFAARTAGAMGAIRLTGARSAGVQVLFPHSRVRRPFAPIAEDGELMAPADWSVFIVTAGAPFLPELKGQLIMPLKS